MPSHPNTRVLVIEDSPVYRRLISARLREWEFEVVVANGGEEGWKVLQQPGSPKLVLMDWVMPGLDGVQICRKLRERKGGDSYVYCVLLTAKDARADLLKGLAAGADDYLIKPFDEEELRARLQVGMRMVKLQEELIAAREGTRHAANHDPLTGLINRRGIVDFLSREIARSRRELKPLTVMMASVDRFKSVNDERGQDVGDQVLKEVARRLKSRLRVYDGVGRYGGQQFLMVLPGCDLTTALIRADQIRANIAGARMDMLETSRKVTLSIGVAILDKDSPLEPDALIRRVECALFKAKRDGSDQVQSVECASGAEVGAV